MNVDYVDHMGSDLTVVNAARVSFAKHSDKLDVHDVKLIHYLAKHNHWTPFGHPQITLRIKAPIFVRTQLFKHKVGFTENEVSRRYVDDAPEFFVPEYWRARPVNGAKQGSLDLPISSEMKSYTNYLEGCKSQYENLLRRGVAPEQARMVLPQSMYTEWYWTGSLAAYARMCKLRLDPHAQKETQQVAEMVSEIIKPLFPISWSTLIE